MGKHSLGVTLRVATAWLMIAAAAAAAPAEKTIGKTNFGRAGEQTVDLYTLTNVHGVEVRIMTYGAALVSLKTPDQACLTSAPPWAAMPIASPRDASRSTASPTS